MSDYFRQEYRIEPVADAREMQRCFPNQRYRQHVLYMTLIYIVNVTR